MTCNDCKYINGVYLSAGFCDRFFHDTRTDYRACSDFEPREVTPVFPMQEPQPADERPTSQETHKRTVTKIRSHALVNKLSEEDKDFIIANYAVMPMRKLAAKYGVSRVTMLRNIKNMGIEPRKRGYATQEGKANSIASVKQHFADKRNK
ncbi:MAG: hypothetical protein IJ776_09570 [Paludibacteraceae bacterium]|nr:hypothetical protein [Paludibacteraceae bacterium]